MKPAVGKTLKGLGVAALALLIAGPAMAAPTVGAIADDLKSQTTSLSYLVSVVSFVLGLGMAIGGLMKFRANAQNPNDPSNKMSTAFILMFVGAGLVALPAVLGSGIATIFGGGAQQTDGTTGIVSVD